MADSLLYPNELILDDSVAEQAVIPAGFSTGYRGMFRSAASAADTAESFPSELLIPESEFEPRIREMEEQKSRLSDLINAAGLPCKDQGSTNYCWINAPTHCVEILRVVANQPMVILSPASGGGPITRFRNVGGWGEDGLQWIAEHGLNTVQEWPANAIDKRLYTAANKESALAHRVTEWWRLRPRNMQELISCLLRRIPVACGYNWQGHETTAVDAVFVNGKVGTRNRNSWSMDWPSQGGGGWYILQGNKMHADDAVAPRVTVAS